MKALRGPLLVIGVLMVLMGLLWIGQGLGLIMWPSASPMLAERRWSLNGLALALLGLGVIWFVRRR